MKRKRCLNSAALLLSALLLLSACGKEETPPEEEVWLSGLEPLAVELVTEHTEIAAGMIEKEEIEVAVDRIYSGSFSREGANEILVECKLLGMPHAGGLDDRACLILEADTLELIAYREFVGDEVMLQCLPTAGGQSRIFALCGGSGQGFRGQNLELLGLVDGEWAELPTGIEDIKDLVSEDKKNLVAGLNSRSDTDTNDNFCYMTGGNRLVVTYEEDVSFGLDKVPSELIAILEWNKFQERFEPVKSGSITQPAAIVSK